VVGLVLLERSARRRQRYTPQARRAHPPARKRLAGAAAAAASLACFLPIVFGFLAPAGYLAAESWKRVSVSGLPPELPVWIGNSLLLSAWATLIAVLFGLVLNYAARLSRRPTAPGLLRIASLGYAIPGTVLAVGLLVPLASLDNAVDGFMRELFGISTGLILTGSGFALVLAYVLRFLAISVGGIEAGLANVSPNLDMAARSLGSPPWKILGTIHLPLLAPAIAAAAMLIFVDCMKELPATLLLQPFNFTTLATALYGEAVRGTYEDAAVAALAIVLVGLLPVMIMARVNSAIGNRGAGRAPPGGGAAATPPI
jgi:iron(III) transport system permease protein